MFYEVRRLHLYTQQNEIALPAIASLIRKSFADVVAQFHLTAENCPTHPAFLPDSAVSNFLQTPALLALGAFCENSLVGFAALLPQAEHSYELTRLCVLPEHRRMGIGERLLHKAFVLAEAQGARKIEIGIIAAHTQLKDWYAKHEFCELVVQEFAHLPFAVCKMERILARR